MSFLRKLIGQPEPTIVLEVEGRLAVESPSKEQIRAAVISLERGGSTFACLTDKDGNYIQAAGSRPWCLVERRRLRPLEHQRAFQETPNPKYKDGAKLSTGAGEIVMRHDEWFLLKDAADLFVAFLEEEPLPAHVNWRSMNETLGLE